MVTAQLYLCYQMRKCPPYKYTFFNALLTVLIIESIMLYMTSYLIYKETLMYNIPLISEMESKYTGWTTFRHLTS